MKAAKAKAIIEITSTVEPVLSETGLDELDQFLAEIDETEPVAEDDMDEIERIVMLEETKDEIYQDQDKTLKPYEAKEAVEMKTKPKAASSEATPAKRVNVKGLSPSGILKTKLGEKVYDFLLIDESEAMLEPEKQKTLVDERLDSFDHAAKKIGEKIVNFYSYVAGQTRLSTYTKDAIELLKAQKEITILDIKKVYLSHPYSPGTASAQSSQMMSLLPALGLAHKNGKKLVLNESSAILPMLV